MRRRRRRLEDNYLSRVPPDERRDAVGACKLNSMSIPHNVGSVMGTASTPACTRAPP